MELAVSRKIFPSLRCDQCSVRHHAICCALADTELHILDEIMTHRKFKAGQVIWIDEDKTSCYAVVMSGVVKLSKSLPDGRYQIVGLLFASDFLGRVFSFKNHALAEAGSDVKLCCFPRRPFERILKTHAALESELLVKTLKDLDEARESMLSLGRKSAIERVASFLLLLSKKTDLIHHSDSRSTSNYPTFVLPLKRSEIADYLGLTIETVSRDFTKLKIKNIIQFSDYRGRMIEICDPVQLQKIAGSNIYSNI